MKDTDKPKNELIKELSKLRTQVSILKKSNREHKQAEKTFRVEENKLKSLMGGLTKTEIGVDIIGIDYKVVFQNQILKEKFGDLTDELCYEKYMGQEKPCEFCPMIKAVKNNKMEMVELTGVDGKNYELISAPLTNPDGSVDRAIEIVRDITERKKAERRIDHLNRILRVIRNVIQLIRKEKDRDRLIKAACESLIETRGYYNGWISLLDESGQFITIAAGLDQEFSSIAKMIKNGKMPECAKNALKKTTVVIIENPANECKDCPLSKYSKCKGGMTVRLEYESKIYGFMTVSIPIEFINDDEEHNLFKEVARDIAFALHNIEVEKKHNQAEERIHSLSSMVEQSMEGMATADLNGNLLYVNDAWARMHDYESCEELVGQHLSVFHNEVQLMDDVEPFNKKALENGFNRGEVGHIKKNGTPFPTMMTTTVIKDEEGNPSVLTAIARDITEYKKADKKIKEYSEKLEQMVEEKTEELKKALNDSEEARDKIDGIIKSIADGLIVIDSQESIILMNYAAEQLLGVRLTSAMGRPISLTVRDKSLRDKLTYTFDKKTEGYEFDFAHPGNDPKKPKIMRAQTSVLGDRKGNNIGTVIIIHDVTHEREVDRMKTEFLTTAAHELRTPLTSIQGFSEILMTRDNLTAEERNKYLACINKQSVSLARIVSDLLDVSRIESRNGLSLSKRICDMRDVLKDVITLFREQTKTHKYRLEIPKEPVKFSFDPEKIEQVLKNLIDNAGKYSPDGGDIRVTLTANERFCQISIEDQGVGMTPEQTERIFNKFYRVNSSGFAPEGTGLGLTIVKHIIEAHKGKVWVQSEPDKGTTVNFTIPHISKK